MKNSTTAKLILSALLAFALFGLSGCNTFKGLGKDFQSLGESMQNTGD